MSQVKIGLSKKTGLWNKEMSPHKEKVVVRRGWRRPSCISPLELPRSFRSDGRRELANST